GDSYVADYVDALGHTVVVDPAVAPDCTHTGLTEGSHCSVCNTVLKAQETVPATGHSYNKVVTEPTCTERGYTTYTCSVCGDTYVADYVDALGHSYSEAEFVWTEDSSAEYGWTVTAAKTCANCSDKLIAEVTITRTSYKELVASAVFTDGSTASDTKIICDDITLAVINGSGAVITNDKFIYGLAAGLDSIDGYVAASADGCEVKVTKSGDKIGTGTLVEIYKDGYLVDTYTVVIFGDVDGDGWYDAQDAFIVSLIANGLLTREQTGEAKYLAADCNHDGEINASDVEILQNAGLLLSDVDQSKSQEELKTDSAYEEYSELVNQLSTNEDEPNKTDSIFAVINSLIAFIVKLLKNLSSLIKQF
ncbi:MAG: dockerin type I repeat-containing protein, partial [Ruminococcus sp.]|nr:dockerin type I repeat-containing protein [Ruminococcus sp.]